MNNFFKTLCLLTVVGALSISEVGDKVKSLSETNFMGPTAIAIGCLAVLTCFCCIPNMIKNLIVAGLLGTAIYFGYKAYAG